MGYPAAREVKSICKLQSCLESLKNPSRPVEHFEIWLDGLKEGDDIRVPQSWADYFCREASRYTAPLSNAATQRVSQVTSAATQCGMTIGQYMSRNLPSFEPSSPDGPYELPLYNTPGTSVPSTASYVAEVSHVPEESDGLGEYNPKVRFSQRDINQFVTSMALYSFVETFENYLVREIDKTYKPLRGNSKASLP